MQIHFVTLDHQYSCTEEGHLCVISDRESKTSNFDVAGGCCIGPVPLLCHLAEAIEDTGLSCERHVNTFAQDVGK